MAITHPLQFTAGLFGNLISFMVFLAPLPTFYHIYKKKSTEGFHSIPYVTALFSSTLWMYYAFLKPDEFLLITINSFGCVVETIYLSMFIAYAPKKTKISTVKLLLLFNLGTFSLVLLFTGLLTKGENRIHVLGWICVAFSACVFAAPLSVMRMVIRTKSVEFMPFWLSFFLTLSAISWFSYGFLLKDIYIAMPNVLGFIFGVLQMILYFVYKNNKETIDVTKKMQENVDTTTVIYEEDKEEHVIDIQMDSVPLDNHGSEMVETQKVVELTRAERTTLELNRHLLLMKRSENVYIFLSISVKGSL